MAPAKPPKPAKAAKVLRSPRLHGRRRVVFPQTHAGARIATLTELEREPSPVRSTSSSPSDVLDDAAPSPALLLQLSNLQRPASVGSELPLATRIKLQLSALESLKQHSLLERSVLISDVILAVPDIKNHLSESEDQSTIHPGGRRLLDLLRLELPGALIELHLVLQTLSRLQVSTSDPSDDVLSRIEQCDSFLSLIGPLARQSYLQRKWVSVSMSMLQQYFQRLVQNPDSAQSATPRYHRPSVWRNSLTFDKPIHHDPLATNAPNLSIGNLGPVPDDISTDQALDLLREIYRLLSLYHGTESHQVAVHSPNFLHDMGSIIDRLNDIDSINNCSLRSEQVSRGLAECMEAWDMFTDKHRSTAEATLADQLLVLQDAVRTTRLDVHEASFTMLTGLIRRVSQSPLRSRLNSPQSTEAGALVSSQVALRAQRFGQYLLETWQTSTYQSELHLLWLLIWRALKATYYQIGLSNSLQDTPKQSLEASFFQRPGIRSFFARLAGSSDASIPRCVEDTVAQYCRYIAKCRDDPDDRYDHLRRYANTGLQRHVVDALEAYIDGGQLRPNDLEKLERAAVRFNFINDGPVTIRRWTSIDKADDWTIESLDMWSPTTALAPGPNSPTLSRHREDDQDEKTSQGSQPEYDQFMPLKSLFPQPVGINIKSAFDYVWCPLPETRAHEVAQSRLISRDLSHQGILSEGAKVEDLIDIPPAHARGPEYHRAIVWPTFATPKEFVESTLVRFFDARRRLGTKAMSGMSSFFSQKRPKNIASHASIIGASARVEKPARMSSAISLRGGSLPESQTTILVARTPSTLKKRRFQQNQIDQYRQSMKTDPSRTRVSDAEILNDLDRVCYNVDGAGSGLPPSQEKMQTQQESRRDYDQNGLVEAEEQPADRSRSGDTTITEAGEVGNAPPEDVQPNHNADGNDQGPIIWGSLGPPKHGLYLPEPERAVETEGGCHQCSYSPREIHHNCHCNLKQCHSCPTFPNSMHHFCGKGETEHILEHDANMRLAEPKHKHKTHASHLRRPERNFHSNDSDDIRGICVESSSVGLIMDEMRWGGSISCLVGQKGFAVLNVESRQWRQGVAELILRTTVSVSRLRNEVISRCRQKVPMDEITGFSTPVGPEKAKWGLVRRRRGQEVALSAEMCQRAAYDLDTYFIRLWNMLREGHTEDTSPPRAAPRGYTFLALRHELGRFIRTLNELRMLYAEWLLELGDVDILKHVGGWISPMEAEMDSFDEDEESSDDEE